MKKLLLILLSVAIRGLSFAQTTEHTFTFVKPEIVINGRHQLITFPGSQLHGKPGEPLLPFQAVSLLIPPGHEAIAISISKEGETLIPGRFNLAPAGFSRPYSDPGFSAGPIQGEIYTSTKAHPSEATGQLSTHYRNGYGIAQTVITPLSYIPATGEVHYYSKITVRIETRESKRGREALKNLTPASARAIQNQAGIQNRGISQRYPSPAASQNDYQILVITPQAFSPSFEAYAQLYLPRGMKTQVATTEFIQANVSGTDMPEKIRNYIKQQYQQFGIEHVVLGGDVEHVPFRGFYCSVQSSTVYEDNNIPSDLYYSALDGNWNTDGDNRWGEPGEDDLLPEVSVGRMSFSTSAELAAMMNKTTRYQNQPVLGELRNPLLAGENLYYNPDTWGSDYLELLIGTRDDNGYTTTGIPESQNIERLYDENVTWDKYMLMNAINAGRNYIHHSGHANDSYVMKLNSWDITNQNFSGVNGILHNFPVIYTHGCICGAFDVNDCIAEKIVSIDNFGAAFIGNSRYGWFNEGQTEGPSAHLHREFTDALFTDKFGRIGQAHAESKAATSPWVNAPGQWEEGALRWCFYDCNVLGDPAMQLWAGDPIPIAASYPASLATGTMQFDVTVTTLGNPAPGLTAALLKNGVLCGKGITGTNGIATVVIDPPVTSPGEAQLVISGYNCLPVYYPITFSAGNAPYVHFDVYTINDEAGNNNGLADFGETIQLHVGLYNAGLGDAENVSAVLSTNDPNVSITDSAQQYGNIAAGATVLMENAFTFVLNEDVPDNHVIEFTLTVTAGETWLSAFQLTAYAMKIEAGSAEVADNDNGNPDPGEIFDLNVTLLNSGHSNSSPLTATLTCNSTYVSIPQSIINEIAIAAQTQETASFPGISVSSAAPVGTPLTFLLSVTKNSPPEIILQQEYHFTAGLIFEDFESGDFSMHPWVHGGEASWTISNSNAYQMNFAARSGQINHNQKSDLSVTYTVLSDNQISFFVKVSSEDDYDFLRFYIDSDLVGEWSGETVWTHVSFPVNAGNRTFQWRYIKDTYVSNGSDAAWIDYIVFPPVDTGVGTEFIESSTGMLKVFPNPAADRARVITGPFNGSAVLRLCDPAGRELKHFGKASGNSEVLLDLSNISPGFYLLNLSSETINTTLKLVVQ